MLATLPYSTTVVVHPHYRRRRITRVGLVGAGQVVQEKFWPALDTLDYLEGLVVCSREPASPLNGRPHVYHPIEPDGLLPLDALDDQGFLGDDTLWVIATPSASHVSSALQLAPRCRVAIEKPVAATDQQAQRLLSYAVPVGDVHPIDHKPFNAAALAFVDACRQYPARLRRVCHIHAVFYETPGFRHGR